MNKSPAPRRSPWRPAVRMLVAGLVPALGFLLLQVTGLTASLHALTSVGFSAAGAPGPVDVVLAALTELCWLGWKVLTPSCVIASALLALATWHARRKPGPESTGA